MIQRDFGTTGLRVGALGFGAGHIGSPDMDEDTAGTLLNRAVDLGVTLIDTARGYGLSEERIGRHLSWRRGDFALSTKGGYGVDGVPDWTPEAVRRGIENALLRLRTDVIDVFHLHSCPLGTLRRDDLLGELDAARARGEIRVAAYSGENEELAWAVSSGRFGSVQTSVNVADQRSVRHALPEASARGLGVIGKRPLANAPWRFDARPVGDYAEEYWVRLREMDLSPDPLEWDEFALRFSAFAPGVDCVIAGTGRPEALERNAALVARGPLPPEDVARVRAAFDARGAAWGGEV